MLMKYCGMMDVEMVNGDKVSVELPTPKELAEIIAILDESGFGDEQAEFIKSRSGKIANPDNKEKVPDISMSELFTAVYNVSLSVVKRTFPGIEEEMAVKIVSNNFKGFNTAIMGQFGSFIEGDVKGGKIETEKGRKRRIRVGKG